jgi:nucleotide-binding universal stress UspA family protein
MQPRKIAVGVDFTDASLTAARWAATHFAPDAEIVLVHVTPSVQVPSFMRAVLPPLTSTSAPVAPTLYRGLRALADLVGGDRAHACILAGNPAEVLALVAEETGADVVCVGRGPGRHGSARFGATTPQRLLARTRIPTLVVPTGRFDTPARVIAAVDDRAGGREVFDVACRMAATFEAGLDALHVIEPELQRVLMEAGNDELNERRVGDCAHAWVDAMLDDAEPDGDWTAPIIRCGDAGQEIIRYAREHHADLIVLGRGGDASHGHNLGGVLLGSTARLVLWAAPCPVLILPLDVRGASSPVHHESDSFVVDSDRVPRG